MKKILLIAPFMTFPFLIGCGSNALPEEYTRLMTYNISHELLSDEHATWENHLIKEKTVDLYVGGKKTFTQTIQYDDLGSVIKLTEIEIETGDTMITTTRYNEYHNIEEVKNEENGAIVEVDKYEYKYDKFGNALTTDYLVKKEGEEEFSYMTSSVKTFDEQNRCTDEKHYIYSDVDSGLKTMLTYEVMCEYSDNNKLFTKRTTKYYRLEEGDVTEQKIETQKLNNNGEPVEVQVDTYNSLVENNELKLDNSKITYYNYNNDNLRESTDTYELVHRGVTFPSPILSQESNIYYYHKKIAASFTINYNIQNNARDIDIKFTKNEYDEHDRIISQVTNDNNKESVRRLVFQY